MNAPEPSRLQFDDHGRQLRFVASASGLGRAEELAVRGFAVASGLVSPVSVTATYVDYLAGHGIGGATSGTTVLWTPPTVKAATARLMTEVRARGAQRPASLDGYGLSQLGPITNAALRIAIPQAVTRKVAFASSGGHPIDVVQSPAPSVRGYRTVWVRPEGADACSSIEAVVVSAECVEIRITLGLSWSGDALLSGVGAEQWRLANQALLDEASARLGKLGFS